MSTNSLNGNGNGQGRCLRFECVQRLNIRSLCTYLGSNDGDDPSIGEIVSRFGQILAINEIRLVCGGGGRGLMKRLVTAVVENGGQVTAVTPKSLLDTEGGNPIIQDQIEVNSMGERKHIMFERADAFVALPGGVGTLEELVEQITWRQLGWHNKPIGIFNYNGFWDPLLELFHNMRQRLLVTDAQPIAYGVAHDVEEIIPVMCGEMQSRGRVYKRSDFSQQIFGTTYEVPSLSQPTARS